MPCGDGTGPVWGQRNWSCRRGFMNVPYSKEQEKDVLEREKTSIIKRLKELEAE
ncbi:MAG: hypothetical protein ABH821_05030 [archaeon]